MALLEVAHFERQRINVRGVADGRMGVLFFDKVTPSCQDICCREIYVTSLKYPFIINAFLIETKSRNKSVSLQRHILILPIFWQKPLFFSRVHADLFFFCGGAAPKKTSKRTTTHGGIPINQVRQQKKSLAGSQVMAFSRASYCFKVAVDVVRKISKA